MNKITENIKFIIWRHIGDNMQIEYTDEFYLNLTYYYKKISRNPLFFQKQKFIDNFEIEYGIKLHHNDIVLNNEFNKPSPNNFKIMGIYIEDCDADRLFNNIRKNKINILLNGNTKT